MKMKHNLDYGRSPHIEKEPQIFVSDKPGPNSILIAELSDATCHWPCWGSTDKERRYCGEPAWGGTPYCAKHYRRSYTPRPKSFVT